VRSQRIPLQRDEFDLYDGVAHLELQVERPSGAAPKVARGGFVRTRQLTARHVQIKSKMSKIKLSKSSATINDLIFSGPPCNFELVFVLHKVGCGLNKKRIMLMPMLFVIV
jgi:hypothetical protein